MATRTNDATIIQGGEPAFLLLGHFSYSRSCQSRTAVSDWSPNRAFLHSWKRAYSTQLFSTEFSDWGIQSKNSTSSTGSISRKTQSKKLYTCFFNPSHRSSHHKTHTHTPAHPYQVPGTTQQYHTTAPTLPWLSLLLLLAASQRGALLAPLARSMYHMTAVARVIDAILPITATPAVALAALGWVQRHERSFGGFRLSPTPPTRSDEGSSRVKHALLARNARSTELPTEFRAPYSSTPSHLPSLGKAQKL